MPDQATLDPNPNPQDPTPPTPSDSASDPGPEFEPLPPEADGPVFEPLPGSEPGAPEPEPFTGEEIARGVAFAATFGLRFQTAEEAQAFEKAFMAALPIMPTPAVLDALGVGEALAAYGIHKGMAGGPEAVEALPPWLRILLGAGYLGLAVFMGVRAAKEVNRGSEAHRAPGPGPAGAGPRQEVPDAGSFQTAPAS